MRSAGVVREARSSWAPLTGLFVILLVAAGAIVALMLDVDYRTVALLAVAIPLAIWALTDVFTAGSLLRRLAAQLRWWHLLWIMVFLSGLVFRARGAEEIQEGPLDLWALYRVGLMGTVALVLLSRLTTTRTSWLTYLFRGLIGVLMLYVMLSIVSSLWSVFPLWTLYKSVEYLVDVALLAAIMASIRTDREWKTLFDLTWSLYGLLAGTVWLGLLISPGEAVIPGIGVIGLQLQGLWPEISADGVGGLGGVLGTVAFARLLIPSRHRRFYLLVLLLAIGMLILAQSRSAITGFLVAAPLMLLVAGRRGVFACSAALLPLLLVFTNIGTAFWVFFQRGQSAELFTTLSGRTAWWEAGLAVFREHPLLGTGAYAGSRFEVLAAMGATTVSSIHNTWLEILIGTGIVGLIPVLIVVGGLWVGLLRRAPRTSGEPVARQLRVEALGILTGAMVGSMFSPEFIWHPPVIFLLVLGYAQFLRQLRAGAW